MGRAAAELPKSARAQLAVACRICGATSGIDVVPLVEMLFGTRERFEYRHCGTCGVMWLDEPPADLARFYPTAYYAPPDPEGGTRPRRSRRLLVDELAAQKLFGGHRVGAGVARRLGRTVPREASALRPFVRAAGLRSFGDPILDVGCGPVPERLLQLAAVGFRHLLGIDPMVPGERTIGGVEVQPRTIHEVDGRYALITFHHSFEHVPDPRDTLLAASRLLRPGGTILIRMPVMGTWFWTTYGTHWWELDPPRHLFIHTERSLGLLANEVGLSVERVQYDSTFVEILASDQIALDIPWRDPRSCRLRLDEPEQAEAIRIATQRVIALNTESRGGRAAFYLRAPAAAVG